MKSLQIAVCEDSPNDRKILEKILSECDIRTSPMFFTSGEELLASFVPYQYDLILMDIYLGAMSGVETVRRLRLSDAEVPVAFVTTSLEFTVEGYNVSALAYVLKPFEKYEIEKVLRLAQAVRNSLATMHILKGSEDLEIPFREILYLEQNLHQVKIVLTDGREIRCYGKLKELMKKLDSHIFVREHSSYGVNLMYVTDVDSHLRCFTLRGGVKIPIRRESLSSARSKFEQYLFRLARQKWET